VRTENVWLIIHPDEERIFVQARAVTKTRGQTLREQGYMIFKAEVVLPPMADKADEIPAQSIKAAAEQWSKDDAPDYPHAEPELSEEPGAGIDDTR
jgi:hypothetical protein